MKMVAPLEVGICCENLESLKRFYVEQLGFDEISHFAIPAEKAGDTGLSRGGYQVVRLQTPWGERLKLLQADAPAEPRVASQWILQRLGNSYLTFIVDDLGDMLSRLKRLGVPLLSGDDRVEVRPGTWLVFARDPEGNVIEFVEYADIAAYRPDLKAGS
ncbi:VOC family protein [Stutzerimonas azotifigens]|uniref:VOC family protein n=1 Tax=Stutzerimonas azotifigens TaxID=291995 RepID=UPI0003F6E2DF|nr:glyoxalase/bleomycin resistance/extradiol dioxygenase family protein [Stutzerimonas azotifigens]